MELAALSTANEMQKLRRYVRCGLDTTRSASPGEPSALSMWPCFRLRLRVIHSALSSSHGGRGPGPSLLFFSKKGPCCQPKSQDWAKPQYAAHSLWIGSRCRLCRASSAKSLAETIVCSCCRNNSPRAEQQRIANPIDVESSLGPQSPLIGPHLDASLRRGFVFLLLTIIRSELRSHIQSKAPHFLASSGILVASPSTFEHQACHPFGRDHKALHFDLARPSFLQPNFESRCLTS